MKVSDWEKKIVAFMIYKHISFAKDKIVCQPFGDTIHLGKQHELSIFALSYVQGHTVLAYHLSVCTWKINEIS